MCCTYDACQIILLVGIILLLTICNLWVVRSASVNLHFVNSVVCGGDDGGGEDIGDVVGHVHGSVIHDWYKAVWGVLLWWQSNEQSRVIFATESKTMIELLLFWFICNSCHDPVKWLILATFLITVPPHHTNMSLWHTGMSLTFVCMSNNSNKTNDMCVSVTHFTVVIRSSMFTM